MEKINDLLEKIKENKAIIDSFGKISNDLLKKINYKFRLDWNYHSNAMEGNSLTKEETRSVMINNITVEGKPLKDIIEMRGHDNIVTEILSIGKGKKRISESRIKEIHKAIMYDDNPEQAAKIGKWKDHHNFLYNYRGEKIEFTPPEEVAEKMHQLINWYGAELEKIEQNKKDALHIVIMALEFHIRYVSIHPFFDGNGRNARILMNFILISNDFPPIIVKNEEKDPYGQYLADVQIYGGSPDVFYAFMLEKLLRSQQIILDAVAGKNIE